MVDEKIEFDNNRAYADCNRPIPYALTSSRYLLSRKKENISVKAKLLKSSSTKELLRRKFYAGSIRIVTLNLRGSNI